MVIVFDIWADFAHFSHPATIYSSITYPIPPKTTVMGILAAIGGFDNTKDYMFLNDILYSVKILNISGKRNFIFNGVKDALPSIDFKNKIQKIKKRKQFYRELLLNPQYRIYIDTSKTDSEKVVGIIKNMKRHKSLFSLYLGVNFCLANFEFIGEFERQDINNNKEYVDIDSFIPVEYGFKPEEGRNYSDIRIPTTVNEERFFGGWHDLLVEYTGQTIKTKLPSYSVAGKEKVVFV